MMTKTSLNACILLLLKNQNLYLKPNHVNLITEDIVKCPPSATSLLKWIVKECSIFAMMDSQGNNIQIYSLHWSDESRWISNVNKWRNLYFDLLDLNLKLNSKLTVDRETNFTLVTNFKKISKEK